MTYIKHQLVMVPTNDRSRLSIINNKLFYSTASVPAIGLYPPQNIYILSDEEIKKENWCYHIKRNIIFQVKEILENHFVPTTYEILKLTPSKEKCKKIIATTDKSLSKYPLNTTDKNFKDFITLPQIHKSFIEYFVEQYNQGNIITEVMVEYEADLSNSPYTSNKQNNALKALKESSGIGCKLKVNPDNTVNIKPVKNSWTKEECFAILIKYRKDYEQFKKDCHFGPNEKEIEEWINSWIKQNL